MVFVRGFGQAWSYIMPSETWLNTIHSVRLLINFTSRFFLFRSTFIINRPIEMLFVSSADQFLL